MSDFMREAIPIIVMYGFVLLLAPFIGWAMWMALDGDRDHSAAHEAAASAATRTETSAAVRPATAPSVSVESAA